MDIKLQHKSKSPTKNARFKVIWKNNDDLEVLQSIVK